MEGGLENVVAAETVLSDVDGQAGRLTIRGYPLEALAGEWSFEAVVRLLFDGFFADLPDDATLARARDFARWPVGALQATKRTLLALRRERVDAALRVEDEGMRKQAGSPENMEAVRAFLEKRPPDFRKLRPLC